MRVAAAVREGSYRVADHVVENYYSQTERPTVDEAEIGACDPDAEVIEENLGHPYGPSMLIWGRVEGRPIHVLCSIGDVPTMISTWWPDLRPDKWDLTTDFKRRRSSVDVSSVRRGT